MPGETALGRADSDWQSSQFWHVFVAIHRQFCVAFFQLDGFGTGNALIGRDQLGFGFGDYCFAPTTNSMLCSSICWSWMNPLWSMAAFVLCLVRLFLSHPHFFPCLIIFNRFRFSFTKMRPSHAWIDRRFFEWNYPSKRIGRSCEQYQTAGNHQRGMYGASRRVWCQGYWLVFYATHELDLDWIHIRSLVFIL